MAKSLAQNLRYFRANFFLRTFALFLRMKRNEFCAIPQFRNFVKIKWLVTVCVSQNSILPVLEGFVPKSETECPVKVLTVLILDMHIS